MQGFRKVDPDRWEFANERFLRGHKHLLKNIRRRRNPPSHQSPPTHQGAGTCVEVGQFGFGTEVERLRRDRGALIMEIVKLRQQQEQSRAHLLAMAERLSGTERKQRQMMAFLARALRSPTFRQHLAHRREQRELLDAVGQKRRLPVGTGSEDLPGFEELAVEPEIETLLSTMDDAASSSSRGVWGESPASREPDLLAVNDVVWEEILSEELLAGSVAENEDQSEIDVEVEDVSDLVEQMSYMAS